MNIGWGLTSLCNSNCKHCYNSSGIKGFSGISFDEAKSIVDKLALNGVETINYGTGESGLIPYFWELVQYTHEKKIIQGLTTNGSSVTESTISIIKKYLNDVDVSIDYANESMNNDFRGTNLAWSWAINACDLLFHNNVNFGIVTCLHALNTNVESIDNFFDLCKKYNCEWRINWFKPTGRGKINKQLKLDVVLVHNMFKYIIEHADIIALPDPYFSAIIGLNSRKGSPCGIDSFRITPNTDAVPCVYFTKEMTSIPLLYHDYSEVLNSQCMKSVYRREVPFCKECEYYLYCRGGCLSRAFLEYGDINAPDSFCYKKNGYLTNPLDGISYCYKPEERKVHENYLCTLIVKPR